jgi:hypothetical protein
VTKSIVHELPAFTRPDAFAGPGKSSSQTKDICRRIDYEGGIAPAGERDRSMQGQRFAFAVSLALAVGALALSGCSGGGGGASVTPAPIAAPALSNPVAVPVLLAAQPAPPLAPASTPAPGALADFTNSSTRSTRSIDADQGGQAGYLGISGEYFGAYANQSMYDASAIQLNDMSPLYAPTLRAPKSCLEVTTIYFQGQNQIGIWDFCQATTAQSFSKIISADAAWKSAHLRNFGDGIPAYTVEQSVDASTTWRALIFNYSTGAWEDVFDAVGVANSVGWDIFETHYEGEQTCPALPQITSSNIQLMQRGVGWASINQIAGVIPVASSGECFGGATKAYSLSQPSASSWRVQ